MRIVIGNNGLSAFGGTESYMLAVAEQLTRTGHHVWLYAPELGPMADLARARGNQVADPDTLPDGCELVLAQDATSCLELWRRYPNAARVFVAHSTLHMLQSPPQLPGSYQALVVLNGRTERWTEGLAWHPRVVRLRQPVDLERFRLAPARRNAPPRVLALSNYPFGSRADTLQAACTAVGAELRWAGAGHGASTPSPEHEISAADIVIGLGRSVLDAMAGARAAFVLGPIGGDGWVTEESYPMLERDGFTGRATDRTFGVQALTAELEAWDPRMALLNRELISRHHDADHHVHELVILARDIGAPEVPPTGAEQELARLVRIEYQRSMALYATRRENARLAGELARHDQQLADAHVQVADAHIRTAALAAALKDTEAKLESVVASRRYRVAVAAAQPLGALRRSRPKLLSVQSAPALNLNPAANQSAAAPPQP